MDQLLELIMKYDGIIAVASAIAMITPTPIDNAVLAFLRRAIDVLALNEGNAKPEARVKAESARKKRPAGK